MVAPVLVSPKLDAGQALLAALDGTVVQPFAAFWWWDEDAAEWQFVLGSDLVDHAGPSAALRTIQDALRTQLPGDAIALREVLVVGRRDRRLEFLGGVPQSGRVGFVRPLRVQRAAAAGQFVDDAWIYRNATVRPASRR